MVSTPGSVEPFIMAKQRFTQRVNLTVIFMLLVGVVTVRGCPSQTQGP